MLWLLISAALGAQPVSFDREVRPVVERRCAGCHQPFKSYTGLRTAIASGRLVPFISGEKPRMPKAGGPLASSEVALITRWVEEGAKDDTPVWWSLRPLPPRRSGTIDGFLQAKLTEKKLTPSPEADRRSLIRRLTFDLHGLPPTPAEVEAFVHDTSPKAYESLVDRLLASPRYGERWARHWLDVVHYGESHGYDKDKPRMNAWPYRDYVIRSFNNDKPYARFVEEQLAGDVLYPDSPEGIVALGFIAAGPWDFVGHAELVEGTTDKNLTRSNDRDDMVAATMSTFTSLTVHCARCHNHKFDPIPQEDYYRVQAVFAGVERADRPYDADPAVNRRRQQLLARKLELLRADPLMTASAPQLAKVMRELKSLPKPKMVYAAASEFNRSGKFSPAFEVRPIHILARGSVDNPGKLVTPGAPRCVGGIDPNFNAGTEGERRAGLAKWITSPDNMLTWRSIVNRVWQYHFGAGLVDTPNDFGRMGSPPSHPELLDWLAVDFRDSGGSFKRLQKMIVMTAAYRQSSRANAAKSAIDSDNRYLWRMNRARLDAESVRDSVLAASGKLDLTMGGPSVQQFFFKDDHSPVYDYTRFDADSPASYRRSIYRFLVRSATDPFMDRLDCPDPNLLSPKRNTTLTAIQALALLNNPFMMRQAEHFAERAGNVANAYVILLGRKPTAEEERQMSDYAAKYGLAAACRLLFNSNEFLFVD